MPVSLRVFLLVAITAIVGLLLSERQPSEPVPIARRSGESHQTSTSQAEIQHSSTALDAMSQASETSRTIASEIGTKKGEDRRDANHNPRIARNVANALKPVATQADIEIFVQHGVILLVGLVSSVEQRTEIGRVAASVSESMRIDNRLAVSLQDSLEATSSRNTSEKGKVFATTKTDKSRPAVVPESEDATWEYVEKRLKRGMTQREAFEAIDASHAMFRFGSLHWVHLTCRSRRLPSDQLGMTFTIGREAYYLASWHVSPRGNSTEIDLTDMIPIDQGWWDRQDELFAAFRQERQ